MCAAPLIPTAADRPGCEKPIVFIHIPKTAGSSFRSLLRGVFGDGNVVHLTQIDYRTSEEIAAILTDRSATVSCVSGHIPGWMLARLGGLCRPFSILRNPLDRVFSLYRFLQQQPESEQRFLGLQPGFSFEDFISTRNPSLFVQVNDGMTRVLASDVSAADPRDAAFWETAPSRALLSKATDVLREMDFGLTEEMDGTMRIIRSAWGLSHTPEIPFENVTRSAAASPDVEMVMRVVERNRMDLALYQFAASLFRERLRALPPETCDEAAAARWRPDLNRVIPWSEISATQGFHPAEGLSFAWIRAGGDGRIHFALNPGPVRLQLRCYAISPAYPVQEVAVRINGVQVPTRCEWDEPGWCNLTTEPLMVERSANTLAIEPPYFVPVRFLDPQSPDQRDLALALAAVTFHARS